ncbi:MAG: methyltransferase domain-containing protein [Deltaproteobacteria bacterium]|nr:MAG: methyltransferase domain-containing protein [Deltaproteobacteria bacterium]
MPPTPTAVAASYDAFPYPAWAFWFTHPNQLAVMATLFGMEPAPPERCRVLEVGCAVGGNLLPMAAAAPESQFVGIDISAVQIDLARQVAAEVGLGNVRLEAADLRELDPALGPFDYVIAHGVFSWVDDDVRAALLALCRERLAPHGVVYVSYNALPGWHTAGVVRDFMRLHAEPFEDPRTRIEQGIAIVEWLAERAGRVGDDWRARFLAAEVDNARSLPGTTVLHEYLSEDNRAFYFRDFLALAEAHGLAYLSDAKPWDMWIENFGPTIAETLGPVPGLVRQAQYLDFVTHRRFRQTLLTRDDTPLSRRIDTAVVERFVLRSLVAEAPDLVGLETGAPIRIGNPNRTPVEVAGVIPRLALHVLHRRGARDVPFDEVFAALVAELDARSLGAGRTDTDEALAATRKDLHRALLRLFFGELVGFSVSPPALARTVPERPRTGALQRWQARHGDAATNLWHEHLPLSPAARAVLAHLDGTLDHAALAALHPEPVEETLAALLRAGMILA